MDIDLIIIIISVPWYTHIFTFMVNWCCQRCQDNTLEKATNGTVTRSLCVKNEFTSLPHKTHKNELMVSTPKCELKKLQNS